ncbi:MAG: alpha-amylase [Flavobacteriaceae bacterium]|nr:alpha-amylase [Flavobacteriaceae bacterium]
MKKLVVLIIFLLNFTFIFCQTKDIQKLNLHVPSPNWEDQVIYFLMLDRFADGDSTNNNQGGGEFDQKDFRKFSGGDIQGVIDHLDYIQNLGATTIWITPPVANQWWDPAIQFSGYHGYWAENFKEVDKHFGDLALYQQLSHEIHERGMYLIQDIVLNHTGNFFNYKEGYNKDDVSQNYQLNKNSTPVSKPTQYPFNLNDPTDSIQRSANIYNWTPDINNYEDPIQKLTYQMAGLDDINTTNIVVRDVLRDSYGYWVNVVGVDGFRIDTIIYVELDFWVDFMNSLSIEFPGVNQVAKNTGRDNFLTFGETFIKSDPMKNDGDIEVASYMGTKEKPALNSMLNYPLYYSINRVFSQGLPTKLMDYRLNTFVNDTIYRDPYQMTNFLDNHDWSRFINSSSPAALKQALYLLYTIPGIPVIYQGTEHLFTESRASMFKEGWGSEGEDHFNEKAEVYQLLKSLAEVRQKDKVLTRGTIEVLHSSEVGSGVLAYKRMYNNKQYLIVFNTADQSVLMSNLQTKANQGDELILLKGMGLTDNWTVGVNGLITGELSARVVGIFEVQKGIKNIENQKLKATITSDLTGKIFENDFLIKGNIADLDNTYYLVIDGKLVNKIKLSPNKNGNWQEEMKLSRFSFGKETHKVSIYSPSQNLVSEAYSFQTLIPIQGKSISVKDPIGDHYGLNQDYIPPTDVSYIGQQDIKKVEVITYGSNLQVTMTMNHVSDVWLPPNGFDHVLVHVFIDLPNKEGRKDLSVLNSPSPEGFEWNYVAYLAGWHNVLYNAENASEESFGNIVTPTPTIVANKENNTITIQFSPDALGNPKTLEGAKIYITTWDNNGSEGGHRVITKDGGPFDFGGSGKPKPSLIIDDTKVITIK